jgi:cardiolipin synthase
MMGLSRHPNGHGDLQRGLRPGHRVRLLLDSHEAWRVLRQQLDGAHQTIDMQLYMLCADAAGEAFVAALERARGRGVAVRLVLDGLGSSDLGAPLLQRLVAAGVQLRVFGPIHLAVPWRRWMRRNHRKVFVFDGKSAIVTGRNIGKEYMALHATDPTWRDAGLWLQGPAVRLLADTLRRDWTGPYLRQGRRRLVWSRLSAWLAGQLVRAELQSHALHLPALPAPPAVQTDGQGVRLGAALNLGKPSQAYANLRYLQAVRAARRDITLAQAYFLPDRLLVQALQAAVRRGVRVRLVLPDLATSDVRSMALASLHGLGALLDAGIEVHFTRGPMLHAKIGVVDGVWWTVGSANLDPLSRRSNLEANIVGYGRSEATTLLAAMESWMAGSRRLEAEDHAHRPLWQRWLGHWLWRLRTIL